MVTKLKKYFLPVFLGCIFLLNNCNNDLLGLFGSTDFETRWEARNTFHFLSPDDRNITLGDTYSFIVVTDTHINNGEAWGLEELKNLIKNDSDIKFVVFNGDITQDGKRKNIEKFIEIAGTLDVPCYPVIGNHDVFFGNWKVWRDLIGSTCYRVNCGSAALLILDSANEYLGTKQLEWLECELKDTRDHVFVFSHVNFFLDSPFDAGQLMDIRERARIISLLKGCCDIYFTGHTHKRLVTKLDGFVNINIEDFWHNKVYCQVWVSKDGVQYEFKKL